MDVHQFEGRKRDHLRLSLSAENQASGLSGLEQIALVHEALPELDMTDVQITTSFASVSLKTPFYVAGMTAGHADAEKLNLQLANACQRRGWIMGVGSQRRELETGAASKEWSSIRSNAKDLFLVSNLGLSQLVRTQPEKVLKLAEALGAQAIAIHANALQEVLQPEGTPNFKGGVKALEALCKISPLPVILKETGCGFSKSTLQRVSQIGLSAIDVSGLGGTHWGRIEGGRAGPQSMQAGAAKTFADWGISTAESVQAASEVQGHWEVWASGGVRSGLDAAKLIALGANRVGYAKPALEAALQGEEELDAWMAQIEFELKAALFCTGCATPNELRKREGSWKRRDI